MSSDPGRGALAGAMGAIVAEIAAETLVPQGSMLSEAELEQKAGYARLIAGTLAAATGQDVEIALQTAQTAVENNFIPLMLAAKVAWEIYALTHEED